MIVTAAVTPFRAVEVTEVLRIANARIAALPWIRRFEIAPVRDGADVRRYQTQIRGVPDGSGTGVEFRYLLPLDASGRVGFADHAWDLLGAAHRCHTSPPHLNLGRRARSMIESILRLPEDGGGLPTLVAMGLVFDFAQDEPRLSADLDMLGDDLTTGVRRVSADDVEALERQLLSAVDDHRRRTSARDRAQSARASGWIDQTALRILERAMIDPAEAIKVTRREGWVRIAFRCADGDMDGVLIQLDGKVEGWIVPRSCRWSLKGRELIIDAAGVPETLLGSLPGRRLDAIFANPELPGEAVVIRTGSPTAVDPDIFDDEDVDGLMGIELEIPSYEIDVCTGRPRGAPAPRDPQGRSL